MISTAFTFWACFLYSKSPIVQATCGLISLFIISYLVFWNFSFCFDLFFKNNSFSVWSLSLSYYFTTFRKFLLSFSFSFCSSHTSLFLVSISAHFSACFFLSATEWETCFLITDVIVKMVLNDFYLSLSPSTYEIIDLFISFVVSQAGGFNGFPV